MVVRDFCLAVYRPHCSVINQTAVRLALIVLESVLFELIFLEMNLRILKLELSRDDSTV